MASRPVFVVGGYIKGSNPAYSVDRREVEFEWNAGLSTAQKRRNIAALHEAFEEKNPGAKVLEISSKSVNELGVKLSAFNLTRYVPSLERAVPVECLFQGGKVFSQGGPYTDLYDALPIDAKRDPRLKSSGVVMNYFYEGKEFPSWPPTAFYNWLWCSALLEHPELAEEVVKYDAFTDIVFNPQKSRNCQAEAAAVFVNLARRGMLDRIADFETFVKAL